MALSAVPRKPYPTALTLALAQQVHTGILYDLHARVMMCYGYDPMRYGYGPMKLLQYCVWSGYDMSVRAKCGSRLCMIR